MIQSVAPTWIDTHTHLDDDAFAGDRDEVVERAKAAGVATIVNIGYRPERWQSTLDLARRYPFVRFALGLHPGHADEFNDTVLETLTTTVTQARPVAIGEIGLDFFHRQNPPAEIQREALRQQLRLARDCGLPAIIHQRAAEADLLAVLEREPELPRLVLHSFDGSPRYAAFARERESLVGVGGLATRAASESLRSVLATIPASQILLETDAPYLVPTGARGRRNEPANVAVVGNRLSDLWALTPTAFARLTTANAEHAFCFSLARPLSTHA